MLNPLQHFCGIGIGILAQDATFRFGLLLSLFPILLGRSLPLLDFRAGLRSQRVTILLKLLLDLPGLMFSLLHNAHVVEAAGRFLLSCCHHILSVLLSVADDAIALLHDLHRLLKNGR